MKFKYLVFSLIFVTQINAQSSRNALTDNKFELGVNITRMLANVLVNETSASEVDFPLTLKINGDKRTFRIAFDAEIQSQDNFALEARRILLANRIGIEKRKQLADKWIFLYGFDIHTRYFNEKSANFNQIEVIEQADQSYGLGISPVLGFQFLITERIALEIETNLLILANRVSSELTFSNSPQFNVSSSGTTYDVAMPDPRFLYLIVKF